MNRSTIGFCATLAILLGALQYIVFSGLVINLWDDGFFWDGTLRTLDGEVPLRDFAAYDIGRYYWSALFARFLGRGLLVNRLSCVFFAAVGLFCAALLLELSLIHI